jgi:hypothetical protein
VPREQSGSDLLTAQMVSGMEVARAWLRLWCGTWEPVVPKTVVGLGERPAQPSEAIGLGQHPARSLKGEFQADETVRDRVPMRDTGAGRPVVAMKPGNAGRAKGAGCSGSPGGQPVGRSR